MRNDFHLVGQDSRSRSEVPDPLSFLPSLNFLSSVEGRVGCLSVSLLLPHASIQGEVMRGKEYLLYGGLGGKGMYGVGLLFISCKSTCLGVKDKGDDPFREEWKVSYVY